MAGIPGVVPIAPQKPVGQYDPTGEGLPAPRRRGLFGGARRILAQNREGDDTTPDFWQYLMLGPDARGILQERSMRRSLFDRQTRAAKLEEAQAEQERARREAALNALPENLRPLAPFLTNEGITRAVVPPQLEWEVDDFGNPYSIQNGRVVRGEGQVGVRQPAGGVNGAPAGYRWTPDGNLEAVPGGPADIRANAEGRARSDQMDASSRSLSNAIAAIDRALPQVNNWSAGALGQMARGVGGTPAFDLDQALEPVRAILSFETLAEMRRNSTTGGALGSIAVRELELLGNTVDSLNTAQSPERVRQALGNVRSQLERTSRAIRAARSEIEQPGQQQPRIIELDPE